MSTAEPVDALNQTDSRSRYDEYDDSGIEWLGSIPAHWDVAKYSYYFYSSMGETILKKDLNENGEIPVYSATEKGDVFGYVDECELLLEPGDLIIPARGTIGYVKLVNRPCTTTQTTIFSKILPLQREDIDERYIKYYLNAKRDELFFFDQTAIPQITVEQVESNPLVIPPLDEQRAIAAFLDGETERIDALIEKKEELIELLEEKRTALISRVVTKGLDENVEMKDSGVEWLGEIPKNWEVTSLKHATEHAPDAIKTGPFGSDLKESDMEEDGFAKVYDQENVLEDDFEIGDSYISRDKFSELKGSQTHPRDVLVTTRGTIGSCSILPDSAESGILHPCLMRIQVDDDELERRFLWIIVEHSDIAMHQFKLMSNSTTIPVIYKDTMRELKIPLPPLEVQREIIRYYDRAATEIDGLIARVEDGIEKMREYRTALISAAVTGQIDVREEVAVAPAE
jgi:type I restriction enzyme S subunit